VQRVSFEELNCSVAQCLEVVGEWWSLLILRDCFMGVRSFDDFQRRLGISRNILNQRLTSLVDHGVLDRVPYQERPTRHEYRLTERGRALHPVITSLLAWGDDWMADPDGPPVGKKVEGGPQATYVLPKASVTVLRGKVQGM